MAVRYSRDSYAGGLVRQPVYVVWWKVRGKWEATGSADTYAEALDLLDERGRGARVLLAGLVPSEESRR